MTESTWAEPGAAKVLLGFVDEIDMDIERWALDRAYMVAGGPFLQTASRWFGWPAADRSLSYVLAVRRLANMNRPPTDPERRDRGRAEEHYRRERDGVREWLNRR
jgi:hypothetical protein